MAGGAGRIPTIARTLPQRPEVAAIGPVPAARPGSVTIQDIARAAGVHAASVSRALRGLPGEVSEDTRRRILKIAERMGYQPNVLAASLRTRQTNLVAIIVTDIGNPVVGPMIQGLEAHLRRHQLLCMVVQTAPSAAERRDIIVQLANRRVAGLAVLAAEKSDAMLEEIARRQLPTVLVNRGFGESRFPSVVNDERASVELVLRHLSELGHQRIAHIHGPLTASTGIGRHEAFQVLAPQYGFKRPVVLEAGAFTREAGAEAARRLLKRRGERPTALFASNDLLALGALAVLKDEGIRVPKDMSLVGHNDMPLVDLVEPPLTTVRVAVERMTEEAARILWCALNEQQAASSVVLPPTLVVRGSTAPPVA
ncbi:MAG TPA: LacI family DNA-binding transcriptional regulator [Ramlibacter sp.]|nr:LacI family DNA-binding transcriptional regulator [Ramlibacter sp.]